MTTLLNLTIESPFNQTFGSVIDASQCTQWCVAQHFNFTFAGIYLIFIAFGLLILWQLFSWKYDQVTAVDPNVRQAVDFILYHIPSLVAYLLAAFIVWNLWINGRLDIPFIDAPSYL